MGKARAKAAKARKNISKAAAAFKAGEGVRVLAGDYGNAHGSVVSCEGNQVVVQLGHEQQTFDAGNLVRGGANDRV